MKPHGRETIGREAHDRSRGAAATAAGRLRVAAGLCSVLFAALWLPGCESTIVFDPKMAVTAETVLREAGPPLALTVRVSPAPANDLIYHVEMDAAGCVLPERLRQPRTVTIAAGDQEVTLTVRTDDIEMNAESCTLTVMVTEGDEVDESYTADTLHVTVVITVPAEVTVTAGTSPVEEGDDVTFTLTATPAPAEPLTVSVNWSETGSYLDGTPESTVTIPVSGTFTVSASTEDDSADEADGTVTLTVAGGDGYTVGTPSSAMVTVTDNDGPPVPVVSVAAGTSPVVEGADVEFTLTATPTPAAPLTVSVSWSESGSYLTGMRRSEVTIPTTGTVTVSASTEDDGTDEADGTVTLTVAGGDGYTIGAPSSATVTVTDDDVTAVSVAAGTSPVDEGDDVSFTLTATPAPAAPLTVAVSWSETGSFLTGTRPSEVTIPASGTATVTASTEDDDADEPDGTVTLTVGGGSGYTVGTPSSAAVTVTDNDGPPVPAVSVAARHVAGDGRDGRGVHAHGDACAGGAAGGGGELVGDGFLPDRHALEYGDYPGVRNGHGDRVHGGRRHRRAGRDGDAHGGRRRRLHGRNAVVGDGHRDRRRRSGGERGSGHFVGGRRGRRGVHAYRDACAGGATDGVRELVGVRFLPDGHAPE